MTSGSVRADPAATRTLIRWVDLETTWNRNGITGKATLAAV
jgi:hypothetical protein